MEKKIIGIDCDEVLCLLMDDFIAYFSERSGIDIKYEDFTVYDLNKFFHFDQEKVDIYMNIFIEYCKEEPKHLPLVAGVRTALLALSEKYRLVVITGRQEALWHDATEYWMNQNLSGIPIEKLIYANDRYNDNVVSADRPVKSLICKEENISIFIDDRERYILECSPVCEQCILFGDYPWTYKGITEKNVTYCKTWDSVLNVLLNAKSLDFC